MPSLRLIDTTWGDIQTIGPSPLNKVHEPLAEIVLPVPSVVLVNWRLLPVSNPGGLTLSALGFFRLTFGCGRGRMDDDRRLDPAGTGRDGSQFAMQSLRATWVTGSAAGAELATVSVNVMAAPFAPPGMIWDGWEKWTLPADARRPVDILANVYQGNPIYPGPTVWGEDE